jgi:hypothetical protein
MRLLLWLILAASSQSASAYQWERMTEAAAFPKGYNFPVHVMPDGRFVALRSEGSYESRDGRTWTKTSLPPNGLNSAYLAYVQHRGEAWSFGQLNGNYLNFSIDPVVERTDGYRRWVRLGPSPTLPKVIFYAAISFNDAIWILGGYDGKAASNAVWKSVDGMNWSKAAAAPWSARSGSKAVVFKDRLYLIGGGAVDGPNANDVWSTADGVSWRQETASIAPQAPVGYSPVAYDGKLWLVGANRSGTFASGMLVSEDGKTWDAAGAPWSPRGGVAAWVSSGALFMTGGKFSTERNGETIFVYSNDVWRMTR